MENSFNEVLLLKFGEVVLKGLNRQYFEGIMIKDAVSRLKKLGKYKVESIQSVLYVTPLDTDAADNFDKALIQCTRVFGITGVSRALRVEKDMEKIKKAVVDYSVGELKKHDTFKVEAKRSDKKFPLKSPEIAAECGGAILSACPKLAVDVKQPQITVRVEIRSEYAYIHHKTFEGAGGMPLGSAGKGLLLLSGGIDSPVAGYMCAKRGVTLEALHFESYPYTSTQALEKVAELAGAMEEYCGKVRLEVISVTEIQEQIKKNCREEYFTLILRRFMMKLAEMTAQHFKCRAVITGESLGQVASQTMGALCVTDLAVSTLPVYRPLIAMDKEDIVKISRKIGTFDISILPYEDCCTVFTPKHPVTNPVLENILAEEQKLDVEGLLERAFRSRKEITE